ncbi:MAG: hypothetical protein ACERLB_09145 [Gammaproteobacteria bacterium]
MASTQFISKKKLIAVFRKIADAKGTGLVSILTDTQRAVLLKFSRGKLIHAYSRSREIEVVVQVLIETDFVKFGFTSVPVENQPELIPINTFIEMLESGENTELESSSMPPRTVVVDSESADLTRDPLKELLVDIASEYIGLVAEIVVEESLENSSDTLEAIDAIAAMIPDADRAQDFRQAVENSINLADD